METILIGRDNTNDFVLDDPYISSKHVSITLDNEGKYFLQDMQSKNGVYVNGKKVEIAYLQPGDTVKIGKTLLPWEKYFTPELKKYEHVEVEKVITFGRANYNDIVLDDEQISTEHAIIEKTTQGKYKITDLNSTNGTFVNGRKIKSQMIVPGDKVRLAGLEIVWESYFEPPKPPYQRYARIAAVAVLSIVLFVALWLIFRPKPQPPEVTPPDRSFAQLVSEIEKSVFLIETTSGGRRLLGTGTGFFIDEKGTGISNFHVFEPGNEWYVKTTDGETMRVARLLKQSKKYDFIIFQVDNPRKRKLPYLKLSETQPQKGDDIFVVGNPKGIENTLTKGVVSALRNVNSQTQAFEEGNTFIQIDAAISTGSSGSPVMNMQGEVVGVASLKIMECENCNFALNIQVIKKHLDEIQEK